MALFGAGIFTLLGYVVADHGYPGGYLLMSILCIMALALVRLQRAPASADEQRESVRTAPHRPAAAAALAASLAAALASGPVWTYSEQVGLRSGLSLEAVGTILGVTILLGVAGAGLAVFIGQRFGRLVPILIAGSIEAASMVLLFMSLTPTRFVFLMLTWNFAYFFVLPFYAGAISALDHKGRWMALAGPMGVIGMAISPAIGGSLLHQFGYGALALWTGTLAVVAISLMAGVAAFASRLESSAPGQPPLR